MVRDLDKWRKMLHKARLEILDKELLDKVEQQVELLRESQRLEAPT
jgi:hypothetical protein